MKSVDGLNGQISFKGVFKRVYKEKLAAVLQKVHGRTGLGAKLFKRELVIVNVKQLDFKSLQFG